MIAGIFDELFGVPTHPLAVHAPVVLIPIAAIAAVVFAVRPAWRARAWWVMLPVVLFNVVMLFVAKESGESLLNAEPGAVLLLGTQQAIADHQSLGEATFILALVWLLVTVALAVRDRMSLRPAVQALSADAGAVERDIVATMLSVLTVGAAIVTTIWLIRTGHAGAESRWTI
jgi:hypothetical protein